MTFDRPSVGQRPSREVRNAGRRKIHGSTLHVKKDATGLKRPKADRPLDADQYDELFNAVAKRDGYECIGYRLGYDHDCGTKYDALHCVDQQHIGRSNPALNDPDLCVYGCRLVHNWLDEWHGPLVNVRERLRLRAMLGFRFDDAVEKHGLQREAGRKFEGA